MKIDITLRDILQNLPERFIKILTGKSGKRLLDTSLPEVKDRRLDLLVELEDGSLFHLELQATNDKTMPFRMLEYFTLLKIKYPKNEISQMVLYVGDEELNMGEGIELENLKFSYKLRDIREIDCRELMESENLEDKVLSVLCRVEDEEMYLKKLLEEIYKVPEEKRKDTIKKLLTLSRLRLRLNEKLERIVKEGSMPITIDLEKDPYYIRGLKKGLVNDAREMVLEAYKIRFGRVGRKIKEKVEVIDDREKLKRLHKEIIKARDKVEIDKVIDEIGD